MEKEGDGTNFIEDDNKISNSYLNSRVKVISNPKNKKIKL